MKHINMLSRLRMPHVRGMSIYIELFGHHGSGSPQAHGRLYVLWFRPPPFSSSPLSSRWFYPSAIGGAGAGGVQLAFRSTLVWNQCA